MGGGGGEGSWLESYCCVCNRIRGLGAFSPRNLFTGNQGQSEIALLGQNLPLQNLLQLYL